MTRHYLNVRILLQILVFSLVLGATRPLYAVETVAIGQPASREEVSEQLKRAAKLYADKHFAEAGQLYQSLSEAAYPDQAAWALELYGVCLEQQNNHEGAMGVYGRWLQQYPDTAGELRVQQRLFALQTAAAMPRAPRRDAAMGRDETRIYGSSSLMYRGMRTEIENRDGVTNISSLAGDVDLHLYANSGDLVWRGRVNGGYLSDHSDRGDSDGRISRLYMGVEHEPSGVELTLGRQRLTENGIYGYFDGASVGYPLTDRISLNLMGGTTTGSSRESPDSDRKVYGLGTEIRFPDLPLQLQLYAMEQTYDGLTERRALGGEVSYFNDSSHYLLVLDYDIKFQETNNLMFNGSWDVGPDTNVALSLGYQRSPFLSASNAVIGEYGLDLGQFVEGLASDSDIYDAAMDKTALSRYASVVVNQHLSEQHRLVAELYHFELSDLPRYDAFFDSPDSDANSTLGLQYIWDDALFDNDALSMGARYTRGDVSSAASLYLNEKLRINPKLDVVLRLLASRRWLEDLDQDTYTVRPGMRLDWYFTPDLLLDIEMGYEWSMQDFGSEDFEIQQGFMMMGLRKRF